MRNVMVKVAANIAHFKNQIKPVTDTFKKVATKAWTITLKVKDGVSAILTKINTALKKNGKGIAIGFYDHRHGQLYHGGVRSSQSDLATPGDMGHRYDALCQRRWVKQAIVMEVERYLNSLDALELAVMKLRYFNRFSWSEIYDAEYISEATAHHVHDAARRKNKSESF